MELYSLIERRRGLELYSLIERRHDLELYSLIERRRTRATVPLNGVYFTQFHLRLCRPIVTDGTSTLNRCKD